MLQIFWVAFLKKKSRLQSEDHPTEHAKTSILSITYSQLLFGYVGVHHRLGCNDYVWIHVHGKTKTNVAVSMGSDEVGHSNSTQLRLAIVANSSCDADCTGFTHLSNQILDKHLACPVSMLCPPFTFCLNASTHSSLSSCLFPKGRCWSWYIRGKRGWLRYFLEKGAQHDMFVGSGPADKHRIFVVYCLL